MRRINLIAWDNGVGLSRDLHLIADILRGAGMQVHLQPRRGRGKLRKWFGPWVTRGKAWVRRLRGRGYRHDLNLMLEHVRPDILCLARRNVFIPNPEWCLPADVAALPRLDGIFAKTTHAIGIFHRQGCHVEPIGFTSLDRHDASVPRQRCFFHLAGRSTAKRTQLVLETWARHPEWPMLTVVQHPSTAGATPPAVNIMHRIDYIGDDELRQMQNAHLFHLCPSETEGFGHYLVEALSVGAITLSTDAEPMNELVTAERGILIPYATKAPQNLATRYQVEMAGIEAAVTAALALTDAEIQARSCAARNYYLDNDRQFRERLLRAVDAMTG